jgi:phage tail sheath protein FI
MSFAPTYPGIYIQELPSNTHTIAAAPTSVTVFVGYTHPFLTPAANFGQALEIFSFSDYERLYGGFYQSSVIDCNVAYAVNEFFTNGGTNAYVVGLQPTNYYTSLGVLVDPIAHYQPTLTLAASGGDSIEFTPLQPTDALSISVTINNIQNDASSHPTTADMVVTYGSQTETYRKISLLAQINGTQPNPNYIATRVNGISQLVTVSGNPAYPAQFPAGAPFTGTLTTTLPTGATGAANVLNPSDFLGVFQADSALDKVQVFNLLLTPGIVNNAILSEALAFAESKLAFFIMDPPIADVADGSAGASNTNWVGDFLGNSTGDSGGNIAPQSPNGALYFPYLRADNPVTGLPTNAAGNPFTLPPSGSVAGIYAATDSSRGVWKAPAGLATTLLDTTGVVPTGVMTDTRQGVLNSIGVNCIRSFPGAGTVVFGARTLVSANTAYQQWMYVPVRRMALFIEQTLKANLTWAIFEPNDTPLWVAIRQSISGFMLSLFNQGAFAGETPSDAFQVKCDSTTTTPSDQALGIVNIVVAFAPLRPAEFVVVKIAQLAGQASS